MRVRVGHESGNKKINLFSESVQIPGITVNVSAGDSFLFCV